MAAKWCKLNNGIAPMTIQALAALLPVSFQSYIQQLIEEKYTLTENHSIQIPTELLTFIEETTTECRRFANNLTTLTVNEQHLNHFFLTELAHDD